MRQFFIVFVFCFLGRSVSAQQLIQRRISTFTFNNYFEFTQKEICKKLYAKIASGGVKAFSTIDNLEKNMPLSVGDFKKMGSQEYSQITGDGDNTRDTVIFSPFNPENSIEIYLEKEAVLHYTLSYNPGESVYIKFTDAKKHLLSVEVYYLELLFKLSAEKLKTENVRAGNWDAGGEVFRAVAAKLLYTAYNTPKLVKYTDAACTTVNNAPKINIKLKFEATREQLENQQVFKALDLIPPDSADISALGISEKYEQTSDLQSKFTSVGVSTLFFGLNYQREDNFSLFWLKLEDTGKILSPIEREILLGAIHHSRQALVLRNEY